MSKPTAESLLEGLEWFNDNALCPKCRSNDIGTAYKKDTSHYGCPIGAALETSYGPEHLVRKCRRCHYDWEERVLG